MNSKFVWHSDIIDGESKTCLTKQSLIFRFHRYEYRNFWLFKSRFDLVQRFLGRLNTSPIKEYFGEPQSGRIRHWHIKWSHEMIHYIFYS